MGTAQVGSFARQCGALLGAHEFSLKEGMRKGSSESCL